MHRAQRVCLRHLALRLFQLEVPVCADTTCLLAPAAAAFRCKPNAALSVEKSSRSAATGNEPNDDPDTAVSGSSSEEGDGGTCSTGADGGAKARAAAAAASTTAVDGDDAGYASSGHSESDADSDG